MLKKTVVNLFGSFAKHCIMMIILSGTAAQRWQKIKWLKMFKYIIIDDVINKSYVPNRNMQSLILSHR